MVVKPTMSADISSRISSEAISAIPRSFTERVATMRWIISTPSVVPVDKRQIAKADDRGQIIPKVVALPRRHRLGSHADVHGDFPNQIRRVGDAIRRVR